MYYFVWEFLLVTALSNQKYLYLVKSAYFAITVSKFRTI